MGRGGAGCDRDIRTHVASEKKFNLIENVSGGMFGGWPAT
jgi:hypothetical protein